MTYNKGQRPADVFLFLSENDNSPRDTEMAMTTEIMAYALDPNTTNVSGLVTASPNWTYHYPDSLKEYNAIMAIPLAINKYYLWAILAFGFPGNLATMFVICRMRHLGPFVFYVALLSVTDNLCVTVKIIYYQLLFHRVALGNTGCRLMEFLGIFLMTYCNWILVLMAVERLIAVKYPFRIQFQSCLNGKKTCAILGGVAITIAGLYLPILWASKFEPSGSGPLCQKHDQDLIFVIHWTTMTMYALVPFIILAICNFLIVREIRLSFRLRNAFRSINIFMMRRRGGCDVPIQRQIMLMLFTVTLMFVLLHFPICAFVLAESYWHAEQYSKDWAVKYLSQQIAYVLCDSNHALNFYIYFICGRKFRSHFIHVFTCSSSGRNSRVAL